MRTVCEGPACNKHAHVNGKQRTFTVGYSHRLLRWSWFTVVTLLVMYVAGTALAEDDPPALSIADAVAMAQEADVDYQIAVLTWENANIDDRIIRAQGQMTAYEALQHEVRTRRAAHAFGQAHDSLVLGIIRDYLGLRQADHDLKVAERQRIITEQEVRRTDELVRIGNATEQDRLRETNRLVTANLTEANARRSYEQRAIEFARRLGVDDNTRFRLDDHLIIAPFVHELDAVLAKARAASFEVWERASSLETARWDLENVRSQNAAPLVLKKAENQFRIQQLNADKAELRFIADTTSSYHSVADAWSRLENANRDHIVAKHGYDQEVRLYEAGLKTDLDMDKAALEWLRADQSFASAQNDYAIALMEFELLLGIPLPYGGTDQQ